MRVIKNRVNETEILEDDECKPDQTGLAGTIRPTLDFYDLSSRLVSLMTDKFYYDVSFILRFVLRVADHDSVGAILRLSVEIEVKSEVPQLQTTPLDEDNANCEIDNDGGTENSNVTGSRDGNWNDELREHVPCLTRIS